MSKKQRNTINITFTDDSHERLKSLVEKTKAKNVEEVILRSLRLYEFIVFSPILTLPSIVTSSPTGIESP